jgi:hypothetical protein
MTLPFPRLMRRRETGTANRRYLTVPRNSSVISDARHYSAVARPRKNLFSFSCVPANDFFHFVSSST